LTIDLSVLVFLSHRFFSAWLATKNVGGAPSDGDESPPRLTEVARGKRKKTSTKKRKRQLTEVEVAQAVANTADRAERGGRGNGIQIVDHRFHLEGRQHSIKKATEQIEEQPTEQGEESEEQTQQSPPHHC
jgi:hypothetical protein